MAARQTYSLEQIKDMLTAQADSVAQRYAPPASGSYTDKGVYFTLNPGRADRSVGSFCIRVSGPKAGRWNDYANGTHGDLIDLIALSLGLSASDAIREARAFLGLEHETPELRRARDAAAAAQKARRQDEERRQKDEAARRRKRAEALWLSAQDQIAGTPVELYLRGRGIDLRALGHQPRAIRYHAACRFFHREDDPETGEVFEVNLPLPAMVTAIVDGSGALMAAHRTYLGLRPDGRWGKAEIANPRNGAILPPKKVYGDFKGGCIRLGNGIGPRGGYAGRLADCPPGTRVYIAEGIETALSARVLRPEARVLAAVSLANMGQIVLPANVAEVVLITDRDDHPQAVAQLERAIAAHAAQGRLVMTWASDRPGEDLNDALMRVRNEQEQPEGAE